MHANRITTILLGLLLLIVRTTTVRAADEFSFTRDILTILSSKCFACHGPDEESRQAELRLDDRDAAIEFGAIVPGEVDESELIRRILSSDPDEQMPPPDSKLSLTANQKEQLRQWIAAGARYSAHWAFVPPVRPLVPRTALADHVRNDIDNFVLARLEGEGMSPSPEADRNTLIRRLYLDLIGLPPTLEETDAFMDDPHPDAYKKLVDRLLDSQHYGERWARNWLDLARYSDTNGYEKDRPRSIWPYRDWVIRALNDDMPFDQFTIEQLAGDMLPNATRDQRIATGFHRNTMLNEEGGIDPLEYRFYAMVDRVATTGTVWLGLTTGCAQCHSHKYDPISQTDYYRLMAMLNNADEIDLVVPDAEVVQQRRELLNQREQLEADLPNTFPPQDGDEPEPEHRQKYYEQRFAEWLANEKRQANRWHVLRPRTVKSNMPRLEVLDDGSVFSSGDITKRDVYDLTFRLSEDDLPISALRLEVLPDNRLPAGGPGRTYYEGRKGDFFLSELTARLDGAAIRFTSATHSYGKISIGSGSADATNVIDGKGSTGWSTSGQEGQANQLVLNLTEPMTTAGDLTVSMIFERHFATSLGRFRLSATSADVPATAKSLPVEMESVLMRDVSTWTDDERIAIRRQFNRVAPELADARKENDELTAKLPKLPSTMIMQERPADNVRPTYRHHRGEYLSPREQVDAELPSLFANGDEHPLANRLDFARWLVGNNNPLTARVTVNRAWQSFFGTGLVQSSGDFGTQSDPRSHAELLDWLATEFVANGWSMKQLHRLIVSSATYRQDSRVSPELLARDPRNRLLARGPRVRMSAETVRDAMLKASGLLSKKMYGPSVYPPQPTDVTALAYGSPKWTPSAGEDRYRRSLYTFSKRTAPFAAYAVFDAPTGESCVARRNLSNTPLQALTLLNDEMYLEMSRALASDAFGKHTDSKPECATEIFRTLITRPPRADELKTLLKYQRAQQLRLTIGELDPAKISGDEETSPELASWMMLARAVMNLDESITKP